MTKYSELHSLCPKIPFRDIRWEIYVVFVRLFAFGTVSYTVARMCGIVFAKARSDTKLPERSHVDTRFPVSDCIVMLPAKVEFLY